MGTLKIAIALALSGIVSFAALPDATACMNSIVRTKAEMEDVMLVTDADQIKISEGSAARAQQTKRTVPSSNVVKTPKAGPGGAQNGAQAVIDRAIDALNDHQNAKVIVDLYDHFGLDINSWAINPTSFSDTEREVVLLVALAILRTEGEVERFHELRPSKPKRTAANVRWAIRAMEGLAYVGFIPDRHLVEAWGRDADPHVRKAALRKMLILRKKGKLQSVFQFELLARLLREDGDDERANQVLLASARLD